MFDMERPFVLCLVLEECFFRDIQAVFLEGRYISRVQCMVQNVCFSQPCMVFNFFGDQMPSMKGASIDSI